MLTQRKAQSQPTPTQSDDFIISLEEYEMTQRGHTRNSAAQVRKICSISHRCGVVVHTSYT